jgi:hypothetical protein
MSIPVVYPAYLGRYQDGGMVDNLGINYLPGKHKRLGLKVTEASAVGPVNGFIDQAQRDISMMLSASEQDMCLLAKATGIPIVQLPAGHAGFLDTAMTRAQKISLYQRGRDAVTAWMATAEGTAWLRS